MTTTREDIAAALTTVDGIKGYAHRPKALRTGDAYPLMGPLERGRGLTFLRNWRVVVILGGDERKADQLLEEKLPDLAVALQEADALYVTGAIPFIVTTEAGDIFAAEIQGRSD